ncbi:MAG: carboxypeptidase regulatory-like domain-containing protein [Candidatus Hydrogenedentes bacterium]|nr:carboxypeptidase regulatory-like domain-containing protein [Candidatus Hydrogenedentota bacterium]
MKRLFLVLFVLVSPFAAGAPGDFPGVSGKVTDASGAPLAGVNVWVSQMRKIHPAQTGADGTYRIDGLMVGPAELVAYQEGKAMDGRSLFLIGDAEAPLQLGAPTEETVQVIDSQGKAVPGAQVKVFQLNDAFSIPAVDLVEHGFPRFRSDDAGVIRLRGLPESGYFKLVISHRNYVDSGINVVPIGRQIVRNVILREGTEVRGLVQFDGAPVAGARASVFAHADGAQQEYNDLLTGDDGIFTCRLLPGSYSVALSHPDYAAPPPDRLEVSDQSEGALQRYTLMAPRIIEGAVLYPDGKPCPGAGVTYRLEDVIYANTLTGMNGSFRLQVASTTGVIRIAPPRGYQSRIAIDAVNLGDATRVTMEPVYLEALPRITGRVVDAAGAPQADVLIQTRNLMPPIYALCDAAGNFEIQIDYMPDEPKILLRAEHAFNFTREDFAFTLDDPKPIEVQLKEFKAIQRQDPAMPGSNNLDSLVNKPAPEWAISDWFAQRPVTLKELKGKVVLLFFWAGFDESLSSLAIEELKAIHALYAKTGEVYFLGIHDGVCEPEEVEDFIKYYHIPFDIGRDQDPQETFTRYKANFIPLTVLIDKEGVVRYYHTEGRLLELLKVLRRKA